MYLKLGHISNPWLRQTCDLASLSHPTCIAELPCVTHAKVQTNYHNITTISTTSHLIVLIDNSNSVTIVLAWQP